MYELSMSFSFPLLDDKSWAERLVICKVQLINQIRFTGTDNMCTCMNINEAETAVTSCTFKLISSTSVSWLYIWLIKRSRLHCRSSNVEVSGR